LNEEGYLVNLNVRDFILNAGYGNICWDSISSIFSFYQEKSRKTAKTNARREKVSIIPHRLHLRKLTVDNFMGGKTSHANKFGKRVGLAFVWASGTLSYA
jgi:hypothetical protein